MSWGCSDEKNIHVWFQRYFSRTEVGHITTILTISSRNCFHIMLVLSFKKILNSFRLFFFFSTIIVKNQLN